MLRRICPIACCLLGVMIICSEPNCSADEVDPPSAAAPHTLEQALELLDRRPDWTDLPEANFPVHPAQKFLSGMTIVLDPGHGGDADRPGYKQGPTGAREAEMNFRVAKLLQRLLTDAGVTVILTREGDDEVSLADRAAVANDAKRSDGRQGADLFISIHHNASGPTANFTTVWFHGEADWSEPDLDVARYLGHAIGAEIRTQAGVTSPLMNDRQMYASGFGVLRYCQVPAVLLECSFFSNPEEEKRLQDAVYNLREAYAVYRGLCEYAYGGRPGQALSGYSFTNGTLRVEAVLNDGLPAGWWGGDRNRIIRSTINVYFDDRRMDVSFDPKSKRLVATLEGVSDASDEPLELRIHFANFFKHHNWPQRFALRLSPTMTCKPLPARR